MFDAYTVKKVVPRLAIATILIQLSWPIFTFMVYVVGQISWGIESALYAPFGGADELTLKYLLTNGQSNDAGIAGIFAAGTAIVALAAATIGGALLALLSALIALVIAFFVLAVRQLVIIALLVIAPLALVAWILPNTEKLWKLWWESFSKLLLMYPLILLLIAGGRIAAYLAANGVLGDGAQFFRIFLVFVAFFGPYFLIPATFKVAGSAFANISGIANDKSRGVFDRLRKGRHDRAAKTWGRRAQQAKDGELSRFRGVNAMTARATTKNFGLGRKGRKAYTQKMDLAAMNYAKSDAAQATQFDDGVLRAQTYASAAEAKANMARDFGMSDDQIKDAIAGARASGGWGQNRQLHAAQQLARTKTGYDNAGQAMDTINRVGAGNQALTDSLRENIKFSSKQVGRNDMGALRAQDISSGETRQDWINSMTSEGFENLDTFSLGREHASSYLNMATAHAAQYNNAVAEYSAATTPQDKASARDRVLQTRTQLEETMKNASSATGRNARVATRLSSLVRGSDEIFRTSMPTEAKEILGEQKMLEEEPGGLATGSIGSNQQAARAPGSRDRDIYDRRRDEDKT